VRKPASLIIAVLIAAATCCSSAKVDSLAVGPLPDGRLQLFVLSASGVFTSTKQTTDPDAVWTPWQQF
jgi:hypothetical protein